MKKDTLIIFLILAIIVVVLQFTVLDLALKIGFKPDDWILYLSFKALGDYPLTQLMEVWKERGIYTAYQVYYIGLLQNIAFLTHLPPAAINLIFKVIATITVFPLVKIVFKNTILAVLATFFFAISYSSIGPLEFAVKGSDYISMFWMFLFLLVYYLIVKNYPGDFRWIVISIILLFLTIIFSPIRAFPLLFFLPVLELYQLVNSRIKENFKNILIRVLVFYAPIIFVVLHSPDTVNGLISIPGGSFKRIAEGNWHLLLDPFSGIGYTFVTNDYWGMLFGRISTQNIKTYVTFLSGGPLIIYSLLTLVIALANSKRPQVFFIRTLVINLILEILVFYIATNYQHLARNQGLSYDSTGLYSALFGIYICVVGVLCFIEWNVERKNDLVMPQWLAILFLFVFTFGTWAFAPFGTSFFPSSYYLVISSAGTALFLSALVLALYIKLVKFKKRLIKVISLSGLLFFIMAFSLMSVREISNRFSYLLKNGRSAEIQRLLQEKFKERLGNFNNKNPALFYFDTSELSDGGPYYSEGFLIPFPFWMHFKGADLRDGCIETLYLNEHQQLRPYIKEQNGERGFFYRSLCLKNGKSLYKDIFYRPENFYAYKIKDRNFIDIKKEVLEELNF